MTVSMSLMEIPAMSSILFKPFERGVCSLYFQRAGAGIGLKSLGF
jgi:hypothetical protein